MNAHAYFLPNVRVTGPKQLLNLIYKVSRHLLRGNVRKRAECQPYCIHIGVIHVAGKYEGEAWLPGRRHRNALFQRIGD
jgi:hypothetical protein